MNDDILESVADNDQTFEVDAMNELSVTDDDRNRPSTADDDRDDVSCVLQLSVCVDTPAECSKLQTLCWYVRLPLDSVAESRKNKVQ